MRRTLMLLLLAAAACGGGPSRGHLVVDWTFAGRSCADAGVANIRVAIANEVLTPDTFNCQESNGQINIGVDLGTYFTGDYQLTISGYDANNVVTHEQTQTVAVHQGENSYAIDVPQVAVTTGSADASAGRPCAETVLQATTSSLMRWRARCRADISAYRVTTSPERVP